jgi:flavin reductase (DIM6/NTAB) family NADH-FMN oxidoreductase RutF
MAIDPQQFRHALGTFATGITVITTHSEEKHPVGVTINSFASVSLDPPLILFSLRTESPMTRCFSEHEYFNVCILSEHQEEISNLFASPQNDKFDSCAWHCGENGAPVLEGTLATLECKRSAMHEGGDHIIFIGEVTKIDIQENGGPLLYYKGGYKKL